MITLNCNEEIKEIFLKYAEYCNLKDDWEFQRKVQAIQKDVEFFQELINRFPHSSGYSFEPRLQMRGSTYGGFIHKINKYFNYYDYEYLTPMIYVFEILKKLFSQHWIDGKGINEECVEAKNQLMLI